MAADGSEALGAIQAGGGKTFAQSGAEYNSMPQNAIDTGHVDHILSAVMIGDHLANMLSSLTMTFPRLHSAV
jgi:chemotaxis response regulator CheB